MRIGDWEPENYRRKYLGAVTLTKALALSLNTVAAKLALRDAARRRRHRASPRHHVRTRRQRVAGARHVGSDAARNDGGLRAIRQWRRCGIQPYLVSRILTRDGRCSMSAAATGWAGVSNCDLGAMNRMMRAVVTQGTGTSAQFGNFEIAGKTGTSQDYRDAWFIGYTTYYVAGVWIGNDDNSPTKKVTGGSIPAAVWKDVMEPAHSGLSQMPLPGERIGTIGRLRRLLDPQAESTDYGRGQEDDLPPAGGGFFERALRRFDEEPPRRGDNGSKAPDPSNAKELVYALP